MIDRDEFETHLGKVFAFMDEASGEGLAFPDRGLDASDIIVNLATALDVELINSANIGATMTAAVIDALKPTPAADEVEARGIADPRVAALVEAAKAIVQNDQQAMDILRKADVPIDPRNFRLSEALSAAIAALQAKSAELEEGGCANCHGMIDDLAPGRDPEELCDTCYHDVMATRPAEPAGEEPVAFMYQPINRGPRGSKDAPFCSFEPLHKMNPAYWQETPLYARPATPSNPDRLVEPGHD